MGSNIISIGGLSVYVIGDSITYNRRPYDIYIYIRIIAVFIIYNKYEALLYMIGGLTLYQRRLHHIHLDASRYVIGGLAIFNRRHHYI